MVVPRRVASPGAVHAAPRRGTLRLVDLGLVVTFTVLIPAFAWAVARVLGRPAPGGWACALALVAGLVALRALGEVGESLGEEVVAGERLRELPDRVARWAVYLGLGAMGVGLLEVVGLARGRGAPRGWVGVPVAAAALFAVGFVALEGIRLWSSLVELALVLDQRSAGGLVRAPDRTGLRDALAMLTTGGVGALVVGWVGTWVVLVSQRSAPELPAASPPAPRR